MDPNPIDDIIAEGMELFADQLRALEQEATALTDRWLATPPDWYPLEMMDWSDRSLDALGDPLRGPAGPEIGREVSLFIGEGFIRNHGWSWTVARKPCLDPLMIIHSFGVLPPSHSQIEFPSGLLKNARDYPHLPFSTIVSLEDTAASADLV
ncbi:hypothetical protein [uncultured Corynebacterium sp.]|uniref:hypothetical protein n=1 Tax=uncultured Corynebacterium sp. TaxID=159447 RepID=UPI0025E4C1BE|nr:hypothetical protein [uncultured Corynebacterium sp.]